MSLTGQTAFVARSGVRAKVLGDLSKGPKTPSELARIESEHLSHVSRALAELRAQGLVESFSQSSKQKFYKTTQRGLELSGALLRMTK